MCCTGRQESAGRLGRGGAAVCARDRTCPRSAASPTFRDEVQNADRLRAARTAAEAASRAKSDFLAADEPRDPHPAERVLGMATVLENRLADPGRLGMLRIIRDPASIFWA